MKTQTIRTKNGHQFTITRGNDRMSDMSYLTLRPCPANFNSPRVYYGSGTVHPDRKHMMDAYRAFGEVAAFDTESEREKTRLYWGSHITEAEAVDMLREWVAENVGALTTDFNEYATGYSQRTGGPLYGWND